MKFRITIVILLGCYVTGIAQDTPRIITFGEAVKIGLEKNIALAQQENFLVTAKTDKTSGLLGMGPSVNINGSAGRNTGNSFIQQEGRVVNGVTDFTSATINARMPLFQGLSNVNSYKQFSDAYDAQLYSTQYSKQEVMRNVAQQYLTCLLDQQLVRINQKNLESQEQQYSQISEQVLAGSRAEVDQLNQEYQVKNANLLLLRAKNTLRNDKARLAITLQLDPALQFELQEPGWQPSQYDGMSLDELYTIADERRADLATTRHQESASRFSYKAVKGGYFPSIVAFLNYGSAYNYIHPNDIITNPNNRSFDEQFFTDNTQLTYGVSFNIPVFNRYSTKSSVIRRRMLYENAKLETENKQVQVKGDVLLAYQNLQDAKASFDAAEAQLNAARVSNELERERYQLGISDIVALTQSNQALTLAETDYEGARFTLMFQQILINFATGTLKFEDIPGSEASN